MSNKIGIVNYGIAGNTHSIKKAILKAEGIPFNIEEEKDFEKVDKIIIPGVGSFKDAMEELKNKNLLEALKDAINKKPTLGICLGMQILATIGFEYGKTQGLNKIDAEVKPMLVDEKVPHVGFNKIDIIASNELLKGLENKEFYFMHSYELINYTDVSSLTSYAGHKFVSSIKKDNIYGVQFHPEKSREAGLLLFKNFIQLEIN